MSHTSPQPPVQQRESIVAFLGIVRFFDRVTAAHLQGAANALLRELRACLVQARDFVQSGNGYTVRLFSDQVVLGIPIEPSRRHPVEGEVSNALQKAAAYQFVLAIHGFFSAGGLTKDLHFADRVVAYGRGLIDTAELWHRSRVPRLVLHERLSKWLRSHVKRTDNILWSALEQWLLVDEHGTWFVNYLEQSDPAGEGMPHEDWLEQHADQIRQLPLTTAEDLEVFRWLAAYHNWYCRQNPNLPSSLVVDDPTDPFGLEPNPFGQPLRVSEWLEKSGGWEESNE